MIKLWYPKQKSTKSIFFLGTISSIYLFIIYNVVLCHCENSAIFNPLCQCYFKTLTLWIFGCGSSSAPPCRWFLRWGCWPLNSGGWPQGTGGSCWWVRFDWWGRGRCWLESLSLCSPPLTPWSWKLQKPWTWLTR